MILYHSFNIFSINRSSVITAIAAIFFICSGTTTSSLGISLGIASLYSLYGMLGGPRCLLGLEDPKGLILGSNPESYQFYHCIGKLEDTIV